MKGRARHTSEFKAKVALAAVREQETVPEIARRFRVHATQVYKWKKEFLGNISRAFDAVERGDGQEGSLEREAELLQKIGELTVERDFLSRGLGRPR